MTDRPEDEDPEGSPQPPQAPPGRRRFLWALTLGAGGAMLSALAVPVVGFLLWPTRRREEPVWKPLGRVEEFPQGATVKVRYLDPQVLPWAGFAASGAAWLRREEEGFVAFSAFCTHTGCPVRWVEGARLFLCPCHAGAFDGEGQVVSGPPPSPLQRHPVRVREGWVEMQSLGAPLEEGRTAEGQRPCPWVGRGRRA